MISLLERLEAADRQAERSVHPQTVRSLALLDWPEVVARVAGLCRNRSAADRITARLPFQDLDHLRLHWTLTDELRPLAEQGRWPPLPDLEEGLVLLARGAPLRLDGSELVQIASLAEELNELRHFFLRGGDRFPLWSAAAAQMNDFSALASEIRRALDRDGNIMDSASVSLGRLRRARRAQENRVRRAAERAMEEARSKGWVSGSEVVLRGDRYCLPVNSRSRRRVGGIVHDRSASGSTLYTEPAAVVPLHNELVELRLAVSSEEMRILQALNLLAEQAAPSLAVGFELVLWIDQFRAGLLWSQKFGGTRPRLVPGGRLRLQRGRHPLLAERVGGPGETAVVPLDLEMPEQKRVVLLSGPNAGGKSVALKTIGVCIVLAQCGWDIPARGDTELPLLEKLFVDLGDEQSIEMSLSSFSAHLGNMLQFLAAADDRTLILCDEIGSGTDPQEGTALAFAVLERLVERQATVLASTHYGLLKAAVHDHPAMINAAMDYDEKSLRPLFTLRLGDPGSSHAFDIAGRLGFPEPLLERARNLVGEERFQIERLLNELGRRSRAVAEAESERGQQAQAAKELAADLKRERDKLHRENQRLRERTRQEGEDLLAEGRRLIEKTVREIRTGGADRETIRRAKDVLQRIGTDLPAPPVEPAALELEPGQSILIPHLGLEGQVIQVRGDRVIAEADGLRLTLSRKGLVAAAGPENGGPEAPRSGPDGGWKWSEGPPEIRHEIDLRGQRGEEAWQQLDRLIDRAIPAGLEQIMVIHGVGTGKLREYLHGRLAADSRIRRSETAPLQRGGFGVTIVHLAD